MGQAHSPSSPSTHTGKMQSVAASALTPGQFLPAWRDSFRRTGRRSSAGRSRVSSRPGLSAPRKSFSMDRLCAQPAGLRPLTSTRSEGPSSAASAITTRCIGEQTPQPRTPPERTAQPSSTSRAAQKLGTCCQRRPPSQRRQRRQWLASSPRMARP